MGSDNATVEPAEEPEAVARSDYSSTAAVSARRGPTADVRPSPDTDLPLLPSAATDASAAAEAAATASATLGTPHYYFFHGPLSLQGDQMPKFLD